MVLQPSVPPFFRDSNGRQFLRLPVSPLVNEFLGGFSSLDFLRLYWDVSDTQQNAPISNMPPGRFDKWHLECSLQLRTCSQALSNASLSLALTLFSLSLGKHRYAFGKWGLLCIFWNCAQMLIVKSSQRHTSHSVDLLKHLASFNPNSNSFWESLILLPSPRLCLLSSVFLLSYPAACSCAQPLMDIWKFLSCGYFKSLNHAFMHICLQGLFELYLCIQQFRDQQDSV